MIRLHFPPAYYSLSKFVFTSSQQLTGVIGDVPAWGEVL